MESTVGLENERSTIFLEMELPFYLRVNLEELNKFA